MEDTERFIAFLQDFALSEWGDDLKHRLHKNGVEIKNLDDAYQKNPKVAKIVQEYAKIFNLAALFELIGHRAPTFTFIN